MAIINKLDNVANVVYNGTEILSNTVSTLLALAPTLLKSVDKLTAAIGDTLTYSVDITNLGLNPITNLPFKDVLPDGCTYVTDSFTVKGTPATPTVAGKQLTYTIPNVAAASVTKVQFQVKVTGGQI